MVELKTRPFPNVIVSRPNLVPREPTAKMLEAGVRLACNQIDAVQVKAIWRAMYDASKAG